VTILNSRKDIMKEWLDSRGIWYAEDAMKIELFEIIKLNKPGIKTCTVGSILAQHGHYLSTSLPPTA
jgi:hypothetical protein